MSKIVGISGKMGVGKTTLARYAISKMGGTKIAFADVVKEECEEFLLQHSILFEERNLYGTPEDKAERFVLPDHMPPQITRILHQASGEGTLSFRELMQLWGTEYRRAQDESYWTNQGRNKILNTLGHVYMDDVRFLQEADVIKGMGGKLIRVERDVKRSDHASETALDNYKKFDFFIYNNCTMEEFKKEIDEILEVIFG